MTRAVVFGYHNVGVRGLKTLLAHQVEIPLILTHEDNPSEDLWFESLARTAAEYGIPTITPPDPNEPAIVARITKLQPDFIFSFYYRLMLKPALLAIPRRGCLNLHGSLLPKYRGRVPVNWAVIHGERETGATLHYMTEKPDNGDIVAQTAVPILPDDTAKEVFDKVAVAAEMTLDRALPEVIAGSALRRPQDLTKGGYFGGRKPEDGVIDWYASAITIHNLVRGVAPPYPGATTTLRGRPTRILRTRVLDALAQPTTAPSAHIEGGKLVAHCGGGGLLAILALEIDGVLTDVARLSQHMPPEAILLPS